MNLETYTIEDAATEGLIFNKKDLAVNFHIWKPGEKNVLYVTGIAGGGKSTLAREYSNKYHAIPIELDRFVYTQQFVGKPSYDREDERLINDFYKEHPTTKTPNEMNYTEWRTFLFECFMYLVKHMHKDSRHLYVVEGIQLVPIALGNRKCGQEIFSSPLLIKNTSLVSAIWRRSHRDASEANAIENAGQLFKMLDWYIGEERNLEKFRKLSKASAYHYLDPNALPATESIFNIITQKISSSVRAEKAEANEFKHDNIDWRRGRILAWQYFMHKYHVNIDTCSDKQRDRLQLLIDNNITKDIQKSDPMEPNATIDKLNRKYRDLINARILCFNLSPEGDIEFEITL